MLRQQILVIKLTQVRVFGEIVDDKTYQSAAIRFDIPRHVTVVLKDFVIDFQRELYTDNGWYRIYSPRQDLSAIQECRVISYFERFPNWSVYHR